MARDQVRFPSLIPSLPPHQRSRRHRFSGNVPLSVRRHVRSMRTRTHRNLSLRSGRRKPRCHLESWTCQPPLRSDLTIYKSINALAESVIGLYKTEVIRKDGPWKGVDDVEFATLDWVCVFR